MFIIPLALLFDPSSLGPFNTQLNAAIICTEHVVGPEVCAPIGGVPGAPGPAPLLGVAAGFHWSRQLRRRIKGAA